MDNRIRQIEVRDRSLIPAEAEVWITLTAEQHTPTTEVRGRLMGPRCPYATTVEVAYPLRPLPHQRTPPGSMNLTVRAVIPEASLWDPESPFLYQGPLELWQDGQCCDRRTLRHGLRSLQLGEDGLRINSRSVTLRGREVTMCSDEEALSWRRTGCNLFVAEVEESTLPLWERADRLGFLMLGRVRDDREETSRRLEILSRHTSCLGWLLEDADNPPLHILPPCGLVGLACASLPPSRLLSAVHFLVGPLTLANLNKPLLATGEVSVQPQDAAEILGNLA